MSFLKRPHNPQDQGLSPSPTPITTLGLLLDKIALRNPCENQNIGKSRAHNVSLRSHIVFKFCTENQGQYHCCAMYRISNRLDYLWISYTPTKFREIWVHDKFWGISYIAIAPWEPGCSWNRTQKTNINTRVECILLQSSQNKVTTATNRASANFLNVSMGNDESSTGVCVSYLVNLTLTRQSYYVSFCVQHKPFS